MSFLIFTLLLKFKNIIKFCERLSNKCIIINNIFKYNKNNNYL